MAPVPAARAEAIATQPPSENGRAGEAASNLPVRRNEAPPPDLTALVKTYCASNAAAAAEARIAWQTKRLREIEQEVLEKSSELQRRTDELRALMKRRDDALAKVSDGMVAIYTKMRPDAAAQQFAVMNEETATTLLMRVDVRTASAILNEMAPERAARLAGALASMGKRQEKPGT